MGFVHEGFDKSAASTHALGFRCDRDRANLGEMQAVQMQRAAADEAAVLFSDDEVTDVFG